MQTPNRSNANIHEDPKVSGLYIPVALQMPEASSGVYCPRTDVWSSSSINANVSSFIPLVNTYAGAQPLHTPLSYQNDKSCDGQQLVQSFQSELQYALPLQPPVHLNHHTSIPGANPNAYCQLASNSSNANISASNANVSDVNSPIRREIELEAEQASTFKPEQATGYVTASAQEHEHDRGKQLEDWQPCHSDLRTESTTNSPKVEPAVQKTQATQEKLEYVYREPDRNDLLATNAAQTPTELLNSSIASELWSSVVKRSVENRTCAATSCTNRSMHARRKHVVQSELRTPPSSVQSSDVKLKPRKASYRSRLPTPPSPPPLTITPPAVTCSSRGLGSLVGGYVEDTNSEVSDLYDSLSRQASPVSPACFQDGGFQDGGGWAHDRQSPDTSRAEECIHEDSRSDRCCRCESRFLSMMQDFLELVKRDEVDLRRMESALQKLSVKTCNRQARSDGDNACRSKKEEGQGRVPQISAGSPDNVTIVQDVCNVSAAEAGKRLEQCEGDVVKAIEKTLGISDGDDQSQQAMASKKNGRWSVVQQKRRPNRKVRHH